MGQNLLENNIKSKKNDWNRNKYKSTEMCCKHNFLIDWMRKTSEKLWKQFLPGRTKNLRIFSKEYGVSFPPFTTKPIEQNPDQSLIKTIRHFRNIKSNCWKVPRRVFHIFSLKMAFASRIAVGYLLKVICC